MTASIGINIRRYNIALFQAFCIQFACNMLKAIKNWRCRGPGNEANKYVDAYGACRSIVFELEFQL